MKDSAFFDTLETDSSRIYPDFHLMIRNPKTTAYLFTQNSNNNYFNIRPDDFPVEFLPYTNEPIFIGNYSKRLPEIRLDIKEVDTIYPNILYNYNAGYISSDTMYEAYFKIDKNAEIIHFQNDSVEIDIEYFLSR